MTDELDRLPVHDIEAERAVLAAMMQAPLAIEEVAEILAPGDFMRPLHQDLYRAMIAMHAATSDLPRAAEAARESLEAARKGALESGGKRK